MAISPLDTATSVRSNGTALDTIDHVAVCVPNISEGVAWYTRQFGCEVEYQDETWAMLAFGNVRLALVLHEQHPPHIAVRSAEAERFGTLVTHRDGSRSIYIEDCAGNSVEIVAK